MLPMKTILHPTDFSQHSQNSFALAWSLARDHGARLILLQVNPPPLTYDEAMARREPGGYEDHLWRMLEAMRPLDPGVRLEPRLEDGDVPAQIVEVAQETGADLIVMGTHGRTGLGRLLLGSVAEQVLRSAPCPVLTLKAPQKAIPVKAPAVATERVEPSITGQPSQEVVAN